MLQTKFLEHANLVRYVQQHKSELIEAVTSPSYDTHFHADASSSASRGHSTSSDIFSGFCKCVTFLICRFYLMVFP